MCVCGGGEGTARAFLLCGGSGGGEGGGGKGGS